MNRFHRVILITAFALMASCSDGDRQLEIEEGWTSVPHVPSADIDRERRELELREFIFRNEIARPIRDEIVYISFGYAEEGNWIEPPDGFVDRLSNLPVTVRSVADANLFIGGLTSKTDDSVGHIYYVQIVERLDNDTVKVDHALYGGPLYGGGVTGAVYEFRGGGWRLKTEGQHHIE